jgi:uncharacterized protein with PhoU and TrkA domain
LRLSSKYGVIVLAVQRSNGVMQFNPAADLRIEVGDVLIAMGERTKLKLLEQVMGGYEFTERNRTRDRRQQWNRIFDSESVDRRRSKSSDHRAR